MPPNKRDDKDLERGERLREIRNMLNMTLAQFGNFLGGHVGASVHNWEVKGHPIPNSALTALLQHGFSLRYLLDGEGPMEEVTPDLEPGAGSAEARELATRLLRCQEAMGRVVAGLLDGSASVSVVQKALRNLSELTRQIEDLEPRQGRRSRSS